MARDARAKVVDGGVELRFGNQAIDDAEIEGTFGRDGFAEEHEFERDFRTDEKRKNGGRERRKNAESDFGLGETGFRCGNRQVAENAASSAPPPMAGPLTTQTTGFAVSRMPMKTE